MGGPDTDYINPKKLINLFHDTKNIENIKYTTGSALIAVISFNFSEQVFQM